MRALQSRITGPVLRRVVQPPNILELGMAFWSTRAVVAAVEFGVFTQLAAGPLSGQELMDKLGWQPQAAEPVLDALVVLGLLRRDRAGRYSNSRRTALFLDRAKPSYLGGLMGLSSRRLFNLWPGLGDLLQTPSRGGPGTRRQRAIFRALPRSRCAEKLSHRNDRNFDQGGSAHRRALPLEAFPIIRRHRGGAGRFPSTSPWLTPT
jgi:Dimerisation domain